MASKLLESPTFAMLLILLAISYAVGYWLGLDLTGSVILAFLPAFGLSCISMIGIVLLAPRAFGRGADRP